VPYIRRNEKGEITELNDSAKEEDDQWLEETDPEVMIFLEQSESADHTMLSLSNTDHEMVRVIEDLIDLLMEKQVFTYTELPAAVQEKLSTRKQLRKDINSLNGLIDDDDTIF
jgi:hypothetical protein